MSYKTAKNLFRRQGPRYNTQFLLYPPPLTCQKKFLLFYMCFIRKTTVYIFIFAVFLTKFILQMRIIYGVAKTNRSHTGILLPFSIW